MTDSMTAAEYRASLAKPKRHKYGARKTEGPDGLGGVMLHDSAKGARLAGELEMMRRAGCIVAFLPEVSLIVGSMGGKPIRHKIDALVIHELGDDGTFRGEWVEAKGLDVKAGKRKRKALERIAGAMVRVV